jgi:translation initiation factor IF-1
LSNCIFQENEELIGCEQQSSESEEEVKVSMHISNKKAVTQMKMNEEDLKFGLDGTPRSVKREEGKS